MTFDEFTAAVERVALIESGLLISDTLVSSLMLDSLQMFELVVEVEELTGAMCDEMDLPLSEVTIAQLYDSFERLASSDRPRRFPGS